MKKNSKLLIIFLLLTMVFVTFAGCNTNDEIDIDPTVIAPPDAIQAVKDKVIALAADSATRLNGDYADKFVALMDSGEGQSHADYADLKTQLNTIREETGAYSVYILVDSDSSDDSYEITIDGSLESDDWLKEYPVEGQFTDAMNGTPTAALSAWFNDKDNDTDPVWEAFAPLYDTEGNIVAILGLEHPAPEVIDYPEWNRDSDVWNKYQY